MSAFPVLKFASDATNVTLAGTPASASHAIPNKADGNPTHYLYIATSADIYFLPATDEGGTPTTLDGATTVSSTTGVRIRDRQSLVLDVGGSSHILTIGIAGSESVSLAPVEW